jgi:hypothetical protein
VHWGTVNSFDAYATLLSKCHLLPVTSRQDFFGISAVEAMYCDVLPILPDRLAFPEHIPYDLKADLIYKDEGELISKLRRYLNEDFAFDGKSMVKGYDWAEVIHLYDDFFESLQ